MRRWAALVLVLSIWVLALGLWVWLLQVDAIGEICQEPGAGYVRFCWDYEILKQVNGGHE